MSDLFGNHIVGSPTRLLKCHRLYGRIDTTKKWGSLLNVFMEKRLVYLFYNLYIL